VRLSRSGRNGASRAGASEMAPGDTKVGSSLPMPLLFATKVNPAPFKTYERYIRLAPQSAPTGLANIYPQTAHAGA
jgi:hypothetical protein